LVGLGGKSAADKGKDTRDYLAAAFPELNAWERAGADASSAGMVDAGFENQKEQIGRASCRERVEILGVNESLKKRKTKMTRLPKRCLIIRIVRKLVLKLLRLTKHDTQWS